MCILLPIILFVAECLDGVVSSPEYIKFDEKLMKSAAERARWRNDNMVAYY